MLSAVRLSRSRKFALIPFPLGINGKVNLNKSTDEKFVVLEFTDNENNLHARRIYFTNNGQFPGKMPEELLAMIGDKETNFGRFETRDNVTHFIFTNENTEAKVAKVFEKNAYLHFDE